MDNLGEFVEVPEQGETEKPENDIERVNRDLSKLQVKYKALKDRIDVLWITSHHLCLTLVGLTILGAAFIICLLLARDPLGENEATAIAVIFICTSIMILWLTNTIRDINGKE